jgi:hypothetical protein
VLKKDLLQYFFNYRRSDARTGRRGNLIAMRARHLPGHSPSAARALLNRPLKPNRIERAGWHFKSVGDDDARSLKLDSYSHQENNSPENRAKYAAYIAGLREGRLEPGWELCALDELPAYIRLNRERLADLIL